MCELLPSRRKESPLKMKSSMKARASVLFGSVLFCSGSGVGSCSLRHAHCFLTAPKSDKPKPEARGAAGNRLANTKMKNQYSNHNEVPG